MRGTVQYRQTWNFKIQAPSLTLSYGVVASLQLLLQPGPVRKMSGTHVGRARPLLPNLY